MLQQTIEQLFISGGIREPFPADPFPLLGQWLKEAIECGAYADANAMALATATPEGRPSVRIVLCKAIEPDRHALTFFSNYESRKGTELAANPRASVVFHWPHAGRQARVEGEIERLGDAENDAYFRTRPLLSRIGTRVSHQSSPIQSRAVLIREAARVAAASCLELGVSRPAYWGGYRLRADCVELWTACEGRLHQRVQWRRSKEAAVWMRDELSP
ncbi:MAG: pyridoxamine 5'-phosphate oxidase [Phycisphaeraceae bacterium]|nr:pyridoxamine 5'-phosphate oxidase [Phycisphaeraceae bacterium]MCW5769672.1 pyridoxamine 5'-phosphate oxidase [Phycisphaeraceae bacterium]